MIIIAIKDNEAIHGSMTSVGNYIGVSPSTLQRWNREKKYRSDGNPVTIYKNGWAIIFNFKKV